MSASKSSTPPAIEVSGLVKDYKGLRPLRVASFTLARRERSALSGLDAVAAEVFVNVINGAVLPDQGDIRVFGRLTRDIASEDEWLASLDRFGIVTRRAALLDGMAVLQNIALPFTLDIDPVPDDVRAAVERLAGEVGMDAAALGQPLGSVPPAVRMRTHLARALALAPELLLLEHATADLPREDVPPFAATVRDVAVARGLTLLAISEDAEFVSVVAERAWRLQPSSGALVDARSWWRGLFRRRQ